MAVRGGWRRVAWFGSFLLLIGVVEYVLILQFHSSLDRSLDADRDRILPGHHLTMTRMEEDDSLWHIHSWQGRRQQGEHQRKEVEGVERGEKEGDKEEERLARELHDLRVDRLSMFRKRTGSQLSNQQQQSLEWRRSVFPDAPDGVQPGARSYSDGQKNSQGSKNANPSLKSTDRFSQAVDNAFKVAMSEIEEGKLMQALDTLHDMHAANKFRRVDLDNIEEELKEEYEENGYKEEEDKEEEEDDKDEDEYEEEDERQKWVFDPSDFEIVIGDGGKLIVNRKSLEPEPIVENMTLPLRNLTALERDGGNIMLTLRTTVSNHRIRLPLLFDTWITKVNGSRLFLVTDGPDPYTQLLTSVRGVHYVDAKCGGNYTREQLCCKAGIEMELMFQPQNQIYDWFCHVDDDMYVNVRNLVKLLSVFDPTKEPIYLGRSGSSWSRPRRVKKMTKLSPSGKKYHFAVGGMYCLSRAMLDKAKQWLVGGTAFSQSCSLTREPEDVTVGFIVGIVLNFTLSRTEKINTHGLHLASTVDPYTLADQVAISYGYGSVKWGEDPYNAVYVPGALFLLEEDESQFRSLHCLLYPDTSWCELQRQLVEKSWQQQENIVYQDHV